MIIQKEVNNLELARVLKYIDEIELLYALEPYLQMTKFQLLKVGKRKPFKPFKAIKMRGHGPLASEMVIQDRN